MFFAPENPEVKFSCFHTRSPETMFRLTSDVTFDLLTHFQLFEIAAKMKTKVQNLTKMSIFT